MPSHRDVGLGALKGEVVPSHEDVGLGVPGQKSVRVVDWEEDGVQVLVS